MRTKRFFDLLISILGLIFLSPLMLLVALTIWIGLGPPVIFRQRRPGLNGVPFELLKFRTMGDQRAADGSLLPDAARLGALGRVLRSWSLDELPTLINVLRGEMSIVGPRPLLLQYLERYTPQQARRHALKPGITGWAQIHGRNQLTWEEKFAHDLWYVDHHNLKLDLQIILASIARVLRREGISAAGEATAREFMGSAIESRPEDWNE